jgi:hypothetical protein
MEQRKVSQSQIKPGNASKSQSMEPLSVEASRSGTSNKDPYAQAANKRKIREEKCMLWSLVQFRKLILK